ncbi:nuclear transport factor 2 family protein [Pseudonocardia oroxyli]|uniref:SnoaL-like domain-containing protein n=1 Tax=Pseudonocardia oroxyli TaxID=366584 RepID=A0A1G7TWM4_PSEOR|nr:nuclear transport factor 2 family protein [Pseudonocardia oroxyli]SDG38900.1 SnoaL-like domain-containing protein [Pseudonocardia oroxyli]
MSASDDFVAILDTAYRYAQAADRRDWAGLANCYTEDAVVNFNGTIVEGRDAIIARNQRQLTKWEATQHFTGNPVIKVDGDRADASFYTIAQHTVMRDGLPVTCLAGGVYEDELVRTAEGWRFRRRRIQKLWMMGDESLLPTAVYGAATPPELEPLGF